jgi:AcrR family transcriptional regulator
VSSSRAREPYFRAAAEILAEAGSDGLTIAAVCERTHVTTGAFYHHFGGISEFVAAYVRAWEEHNTREIGVAAAEPDPVRRLERLIDFVVTMPHPAEAAFRAWGKTNATVGATVRRVTAFGTAAAEAVLTELVGDPGRAAVLAHMAGSIAIGMQTADEPVDLDLFAAVAAEWVRSCVGLDAEIVPDPDRAGPRLLISRRPAAPH